MGSHLRGPARLKARCDTRQLTIPGVGLARVRRAPHRLAGGVRLPSGFPLPVRGVVLAFDIHRLPTPQAVRPQIPRTIAQPQWRDDARSHLCTPAIVHYRDSAFTRRCSFSPVAEAAPRPSRFSAETVPKLTFHVDSDIA